MARILRHDSGRDVYPYIQIWRPSSSMPIIYNKVDEVLVEQSQLQNVVGDGDDGRRVYQRANITLTGDDRILVQSGDVVGFYHQSNSINQVRTSTETVQGYVLYFFAGSNVGTLNHNDATATYNGRQPLMQFTLGKLHSLLELRNFYFFSDIQCNNLPTLSNGGMSCSSGSDGVGYEGDTCSFTCNTGYELTGSDTRTCQSDGSWSGSEMMCRRGDKCL